MREHHLRTYHHVEGWVVDAELELAYALTTHNVCVFVDCNRSLVTACPPYSPTRGSRGWLTVYVNSQWKEEPQLLGFGWKFKDELIFTPTLSTTAHTGEQPDKRSLWKHQDDSLVTPPDFCSLPTVAIQAVWVEPAVLACH